MLIDLNNTEKKSFKYFLLIYVNNKEKKSF